MAGEFGPDIQVGEITFTDELGAYQAQDDGVWNNYLVRNIYYHDPHRYMLGITSPNGFQGQSAAFVQLAASTELWVADWMASRFTTVPLLPDPDTGDTNWVFLGCRIEPAQLALAPDGVSQLYSINGIYVYGRKNPSQTNVFADVAFPLPPWMENRFSRTVPSAALQKGIITATTGTGPGSIGLAR